MFVETLRSLLPDLPSSLGLLSFLLVFYYIVPLFQKRKERMPPLVVKEANIVRLAFPVAPSSPPGLVPIAFVCEDGEVLTFKTTPEIRSLYAEDMTGILTYNKFVFDEGTSSLAPQFVSFTRA